LARRVALVAAVLLLCSPAVARANGDPASDYLLVQSVFLPFNGKIDPDATARLSDVIRAANQAGFRIRVAVIGSRYDLGTAFSLFKQPQRYAEFLGLELSFQYHDRLLVVMPSGYGYSVNGKPKAAGIRVVKTLPAPGSDPTKEVERATAAIRRLAAAEGHVLPAGGGESQTRDRLVIAAGATALVALLAAIVFWRRRPGPTL
jgi:hypothetical protein